MTNNNETLLKKDFKKEPVQKDMYLAILHVLKETPDQTLSDIRDNLSKLKYEGRLGLGIITICVRRLEERGMVHLSGRVQKRPKYSITDTGIDHLNTPTPINFESPFAPNKDRGDSIPVAQKVP
ncbi:MAG: hypothetical protein R3E13_10490 [Alphaproteobacteria bacterium]